MKVILSKKIIGFLLLFVIFMYLFSGRVLADTTQIDLNSLENIEVITNTNNTTNNITNNTTENTTNNIVNNTTNITADTQALPQTGSNNEIIFIIVGTVLVGTTIYIYKKTNLYKDID